MERFRTNGALPGAILRGNSRRYGDALPADRSGGGWRRQVRLLLGVDKVLSTGRLLNGLS